jgi:hypothetical protein
MPVVTVTAPPLPAPRLTAVRGELAAAIAGALGLPPPDVRAWACPPELVWVQWVLVHETS